MSLDPTRTRAALKAFDFRKLFIEELGWDKHAQSMQVEADGAKFQLSSVAHKRGMVVYVCQPADGKVLPLYATRRKIERLVSKVHFEHLIIFIDAAKSTQRWQWVKREPGRPAACRETEWHTSQSGEALIQKLHALVVTLDEEDNLNVPDVSSKVKKGFDVERITKRFFDQFEKEHGSFTKFIKGIPDGEMLAWYVSVMLNRLMFIYFVQKKGFLGGGGAGGGDRDYLRNKLVESKKRGKDCFYTDFLCRLFFDGFAMRESERSDATKKLLGSVPYLNGGIFLKHQIEELHGKKIEIADTAFDKLFAFFDLYQWHLDERPLRQDNEINPDVLGYIFEKYINQKQMGAYYTKEDITEYISKNTIIPFLFGAAEKDCPIAFRPGSHLWKLVAENPDRYIYDAVRKGVVDDAGKVIPLPKEIEAGITDIPKRAGWNKPASAPFALPTETWREHVARRQRCLELREKLANGEVHSINELITLNLNIRQFAQDVIVHAEGPELVRALYEAIARVTVLDPTCGSGAFLFAALNILEPLYEACLRRMQAFISEAAVVSAKGGPERFADFKKVLDRIDLHPNRRYFILKSIIVGNLYGVDIMEEAVEICKLRLFLKLVAQVEEVKHIEPLPDIDFNIRAGNTLVGFANYAEATKAIEFGSLDFEGKASQIDQGAANADRLFRQFRDEQLNEGAESSQLKRAQKSLFKQALHNLGSELDTHLATSYGFLGERKLAEFRKRYLPFHWFVEFYGIVKAGGFDVIIGHPPYVEYKDVSDTYTVKGYKTLPCGDLYAFVTERSLQLLSETGSLGLIVPISISSVDGFSSLRSLLTARGGTCWSSTYAERPAKLFDGVEKRLSIWLQRPCTGNLKLFTSAYRRWQSVERPCLFGLTVYVDVDAGSSLVGTSWPKLGTTIEQNILSKLHGFHALSVDLVKSSKHEIIYTRKLRYFIQFLDFVPKIKDGSGRIIEPTELKLLYAVSASERHSAIAALNSSLFFWFFCAFSDIRNVNRREIEAFPISLKDLAKSLGTRLAPACRHLMSDFDEKSITIANHYKKDDRVLRIQSFQPRESKALIDVIDHTIALHYGLSEHEVDFIVNYDFKYRMGADESDEE